MEPVAVDLVKTALGPADSGTVEERITHAREEFTSAGEILDLLEELLGNTADENASLPGESARADPSKTAAKPADKNSQPKPAR